MKSDIKSLKTIISTKEMRASVWLSVSSILQKLIAFIVVPIYTRLMTAEQYGEYSVFLSWYQIIMIFCTLNMWNYLIVNGMTKYSSERSEFISSLQGLSTVITLVFFVVYLINTQFWGKIFEMPKCVMVAMFLELLFMPSYEYWCARKRYEYDIKGVVYSSVMISLLFPIISIPIIMISTDKGTAAIMGRVIVSTLVYIVTFVEVAKKGKKWFDINYWAFALKFSMPLIPHFLSSVILMQSDRIMIERIIGGDYAAFYSVAYSIAGVTSIFSSAILASFVPYTYQQIKEGFINRINNRASQLFVLIGMVNLLLVWVSPELIKIVAPIEYRSAIYIIPPIAMSNVCIFLFNLFANIEYYYEKTIYVAIASCVCAVINIILNAYLLPIYGYSVAGYTTLISYVLYALGHYLFMKIVLRRYLNGAKVYNERILLGLFFLFVMMILGSVFLYKNLLIRYVLILLMMIGIFAKRKTIIKFFLK